MKITESGVTFETRECWSCHGVGTVQQFEPCPNAGQTFRKGCPICSKTRKADHSYRPEQTRRVCTVCSGQGVYLETLYDTDSQGFYRTLPWTVARSDRRMSEWEYQLGAGLVTVGDYGRHKALSDAELITAAQDACKGPQYVKFIRKDLRVADQLVVLTSDMGYTVLPHFMETK